MNTFKSAIEVKEEIKRLINVSVEITDNKIYKKGGKKYVLTAEKLGGLFCQKTSSILRLHFVSDIHSAGFDKGIIYIN